MLVVLVYVTRPLDRSSCGSERKDVALPSRARWVEAAGVAEVVESKGNMWLTTGVTRGAKLFYNIEEIGYATCSMKCPSYVRLLVVLNCTDPR
jgi:tRNA-splicing endonuclease subunit Sen54